ncbi:hypothetical protein [Streptomyces griseicoloratus]|nr:hypothetical protein [Streptomyces griseicoloratus]
MIAFEIAQGMAVAKSGIAKLERTPMPPPKIRNRVKEVTGPGDAGVAFPASSARGDGMGGPSSPVLVVVSVIRKATLSSGILQRVRCTVSALQQPDDEKSLQ